MDENLNLKTHKTLKILFFVLGPLMAIGGAVLLILVLTKPVEEKIALTFPTIPSKTTEQTNYSVLTGKPIASAEENNAPIYCIQTPNGTDGGRPQVGLSTAGVVFEAIAEAGITRFAAIYQNPTSSIIGPIRSLRIYFLEWDTPFDCTIVHAGGAQNAIAAVNAGGYKDLTENYAYMYRGTVGARLWNNLFTTSDYLKQVYTDRGYSNNNIKGFTHTTPEQANQNRADSLVKEKLSITTASTTNTSELTPKVTDIRFSFGNIGIFNPVYHYDVNTNTYLRSYASGDAHNAYVCPEGNLGERNPEEVCELKQLAPSVVIGMIVQERKDSDGYHEAITTTGSGTAYVFQNGTAIKGTWRKDTRADQIKFFDEGGNEIALNPGQTWISAIPNYGGVEY